MNTIKSLSALNGRRALVTGAAGNLGKVIAQTLAELGADLILVDRLEPELEGLCNTLISHWGIRAEYKICDLEIQSQRTKLTDSLKNTDKGLNILINNAAFVGTDDLQGWSEPFEKQTVDTWRRGLEVNLTAVFDLTQSLVPLLKISEGACIVNIASIYGMYGPDWSLYDNTDISNPAAYAASKGGLIQLSRWLATSIKPNIRVNSLSPGGIYRNQPEVFVNRYEAKTPLGRMATEDDFRGAIAFLATDLSKYVTGQNLVIDGGWGVW